MVPGKVIVQFLIKRINLPGTPIVWFQCAGATILKAGRLTLQLGRRQ